MDNSHGCGTWLWFNDIEVLDIKVNHPGFTTAMNASALNPTSEHGHCWTVHHFLFRHDIVTSSADMSQETNRRERGRREREKREGERIEERVRNPEKIITILHPFKIQS